MPLMPIQHIDFVLLETLDYSKIQELRHEDLYYQLDKLFFLNNHPYLMVY